MFLVKYSQSLAKWIDVGGESGDKLIKDKYLERKLSLTRSHRRENNRTRHVLISSLVFEELIDGIYLFIVFVLGWASGLC